MLSVDSFGNVGSNPTDNVYLSVGGGLQYRFYSGVARSSPSSSPTGHDGPRPPLTAIAEQNGTVGSRPPGSTS